MEIRTGEGEDTGKKMMERDVVIRLSKKNLEEILSQAMRAGLIRLPGHENFLEAQKHLGKGLSELGGEQV